MSEMDTVNPWRGGGEPDLSGGLAGVQQHRTPAGKAALVQVLKVKSGHLAQASHSQTSTQEKGMEVCFHTEVHSQTHCRLYLTMLRQTDVQPGNCSVTCHTVSNSAKRDRLLTYKMGQC